MGAGDSFDCLKPWPQKSPPKRSRAWPQFSGAGGSFQLLVRPREEVCTLQVTEWNNLPAQNSESGGFWKNLKSWCVCVGAPTQELPVAEWGVLGVTAAPFVERGFSCKCRAGGVYLSETGTSKFSVGKKKKKMGFLNGAQRALSWLCQVHLFSIHPKPFLQLSEPHRRIYTVRLLR